MLALSISSSEESLFKERDTVEYDDSSHPKNLVLKRPFSNIRKTPKAVRKPVNEFLDLSTTTHIIVDAEGI